MEDLADRAEHRRARGEVAARRLVGDQMEVPSPLLEIGVLETVPFLRQRPQRFRQHRPRRDEDRELAASRGPDGTRGGDDVAEVDLVEEREGLRVELRLVADELDVPAAVAEREELELAHVPLQHDATGHGDALLFPVIRREVAVAFAEIRGRHRLLDADRVAERDRERPVTETVQRRTSSAQDLLLARAAARVLAGQSSRFFPCTEAQAFECQERLVVIDRPAVRDRPPGRGRRWRSWWRRPGRAGSDRRSRRPHPRCRRRGPTGSLRRCSSRSPTAGPPAPRGRASRLAGPTWRRRSADRARSRPRGTHPGPRRRRSSSRCRSRRRSHGPPNRVYAARVFTIRSAPTSRGLSVNTDTPVLVPGPTTSGSNER